MDLIKKCEERTHTRGLVSGHFICHHTVKDVSEMINRALSACDRCTQFFVSNLLRQQKCERFSEAQQVFSFNWLDMKREHVIASTDRALSLN